MAPKKKGNKKGNDDWEADLGETPDPIAAAAQEAKEIEAAQDAEPDEAPGGGGGLLAALKKNKSNKKKKGKVVEEDYVGGEDLLAAADGVNGHAEPNGVHDLASKAPEEATTEDLFEEQVTKTKGGKGKQGKKDETLEPNEDGDGEDADEGGTGGVKSKKEKEKEKKEREKARKKEQVRVLLQGLPDKRSGTQRRKPVNILLVSGCCKEEARRRTSSTKGGAYKARSRSEA